MKNLVISDKAGLDEKIRRIAEAGKEELHVLADFDRTLTKAFVSGVKSSTVIAQIRNGNYLTPDYAPRAHKLFDVYHPIEVDRSVSGDVKNAKMHEWWKKHFDLLIECGLSLEVMREIVGQRTLQFREGTLEFLDLLHEKKIPLVIMSAGPGDMIKMYLEQEGRLYDKVYVVANFLKFDKKGRAIGVPDPIIHSCNKHEVELKKLPVYNELKRRRNVLLLGDGLEDLGMVEGFDYKTLVSVGFYNEKKEEDEKKYEEGFGEFKRRFDAVVLNDGDMGYANGIVGKIN